MGAEKETKNDSNENKTETIGVRVTPHEKMKLEHDRRRAHFPSLSSYMLHCALEMRRVKNSYY